jgi:hypothetical protein
VGVGGRRQGFESADACSAEHEELFVGDEEVEIGGFADADTDDGGVGRGEGCDFKVYSVFKVEG